MRVTFLESSHGIRLTKTISATESKSYPDVKTVNSSEYPVPNDANWASTFASLIDKHGALGHCLLKGPLKKPAINESRAGLGDKIAYSDLLVLDIDNLKVPNAPKSPISSADIHLLADSILGHLGPDFANLSYVAQASSSLGRKADRVSLHIFIALSIPLPPKSIKLWLKHINLSVQLFKDQIDLSSTGQSLRFPLDPSVADNTKLIFISPPDFTDPTLDPFKSAADRIAIVQRSRATLDLAALLGTLNPEKVFEHGVEVKEELREKAGLKKRTPKLVTVNVGGDNLEVITNPDKMSINIVNEELPYVRCNINGGDSGAYYFNIQDPTYMFNFKDEPIFEIEKADRDFHASIFEKYRNNPDKPGAVRPLQPIVFRDYFSDTLYNGVFDPNTQRFTDAFPLTITSSGAIEGFMRSHGQAVPSFIPEAKVVFDPPKGDQPPNLDTIPYYVNMYRPTPIQDAAVIPEQPLAYDTAADMQTVCPKIYTLMDHMLGNGKEELNHFMNWLAFIYQKRSKTMTAWVLGGVPGTGKGAFVNKVLRPIFGEHHVPMKALENIEEQFNNFMRTAIFLVVDEFRMSDTKGGYSGATRIADKLKNQITEPTLTIRSMRTNQVELPSFTNFIFLTNRQDAVKIEAGDRRYNVAPRQEKKLIDVHPDLVRNIDDVSKELHAFAGVLETFKVDVAKARTCLNNEAKENMKAVTMSVFDDFCDGFHNGNLNSFVEVLDIQLTNTFEANQIITAGRFVKSWIADAAAGRDTIVTPEHMRVIYHVLNSNQQALSPRQFGKMLARNGLESKPTRGHSHALIRGVKVTWKIHTAQVQELIDTYFGPEDQALLPKKAKA